MGYKKSIFNDKTIIAASAVGILALAAIAGGIFLGTSGDDNKGKIVDLDENATTSFYQEMASEPDTSERVADNNEINNQENTTEPENVTVDEPVIEEETTQIHENVQDVNVGNDIIALNFSPSSVLVWPVEGNVLIEYDMENTVYFSTLDLYKCSDAVCIQSAVDTPVYAASACSVEGIDYNTEIGNNITVSLGNGYELTYGQLKDLQVANGDVLEEGDLIGYVATPTKYYTVEGPNLYMKMTLNGQAVDPLDYLDYE